MGATPIIMRATPILKHILDSTPPPPYKKVLGTARQCWQPRQMLLCLKTDMLDILTQALKFHGKSSKVFSQYRRWLMILMEIIMMEVILINDDSFLMIIKIIIIIIFIMKFLKFKVVVVCPFPYMHWQFATFRWLGISHFFICLSHLCFWFILHLRANKISTFASTNSSRLLYNNHMY